MTADRPEWPVKTVPRSFEREDAERILSRYGWVIDSWDGRHARLTMQAPDGEVVYAVLPEPVLVLLDQLANAQGRSG